MIARFRTIIPHVLYRGGSPSPKDVMHLKNKLGIKKIVSLDQRAGDMINPICHQLGIKHVKMYIEGTERKSLLHFLSQDMRKLFLEGGPTFLHCYHGKDRSSLASAIVECKFLGKNPEQAIQEAKKLGFGVGLYPAMTKLYEKIIRSCKPEKKLIDHNSADIVGNERDYKSDNRDSFLDEAHMSSFAPYLDPTREYPYNADPNPTRENINQPILPYDQSITDAAPVVGLFNNDAGISGAGPVTNMTGFLYE